MTADVTLEDMKKDRSVENDVKEYLASDQFTTLLSTIIKTSISTPPVDKLTVSAKRNESRTTETRDSRKLSRESEITLWLASQPPSYKTHAYHHDGDKYIMYLANYKDSHLPLRTINSYHSVVGVYEYIRQHARQHNILLTPAHEVQPWRPDLHMEPPTCPFNAAITFNKDDTYAKAANALYAKMQKSIRFDDVPALESTFNATASEADGYLALYRLLQFGHPRFQTKMDEVKKPVLKTRNILFFCEEMKHWAMYQNLIKNTQKEIYLFHYVVQEIRRQYGDDYERGLNHLVAKVSFWQCQLDEHAPPVISHPTFPSQATITDGTFALSLMQHYDTEESKHLFSTDTSPAPSHTDAVDKVHRIQQPRQQRRGRDPRGVSSYKPVDKKKANVFKYKEGIVCELCGKEGHIAMEDGCFDAAKFLRMLKKFSPGIYRRVEQRDPDLTKILETKLDELNRNMSLRRKQRRGATVKSTSINNAITMVEQTGNNTDIASDLWHVTKTVFDFSDSENDDEQSCGSDYKSTASE